MQQSDLSSFPFLDAAGKDGHLLNASLHILTLELISTFVKDKHLLNTLFPMNFTEDGIIISLITVNEDESDTINNEEHFEKSKFTYFFATEE